MLIKSSTSLSNHFVNIFGNFLAIAGDSEVAVWIIKLNILTPHLS
jgi:hypothetical protein